MGANAPHVIGHQPIAPLGHPRHVVMRPVRRGPDPHEPHAHRVCDGRDLFQMVAQFGGGFVHVRHRRAGKFKLSAGLKADIGPIALQADHLAAFAHALPSEPLGQPLEQRRDRGITRIGQRFMAARQPAKLFMLGAHAPLGSGLVARFHHSGQLIKRLDRAAARLRDRHGWQAPVFYRGQEVKTCPAKAAESRDGDRSACRYHKVLSLARPDPQPKGLR